MQVRFSTDFSIATSLRQASSERLTSTASPTPADESADTATSAADILKITISEAAKAAYEEFKANGGLITDSEVALSLLKVGSPQTEQTEEPPTKFEVPEEFTRPEPTREEGATSTNRRVITEKDFRHLGLLSDEEGEALIRAAMRGEAPELISFTVSDEL
ncbi:hypothetical protein, partial [Asticcacaulis sp. W401b]|uniref:hypothetical protein n=1 Tax=Asticcacaulis sp. W401b TaxID=3388666 RepID=UPI003970B943